ncbi:MAG: CDP-glycerol glycerophosphotransferase family protein [Ruminococcus sp.]|nr:CDP-glycerol glycerophosphotransferase family protein [Ruminococcus sp.]
MDSRHGEALAGNILELVCAISNRANIRIVLTTNKRSRPATEAALKERGITNVKLVDIKSLGCYKQLSRAKYIFTDVSLPMRFIKRPGQVIVNTWHGTPLKCLGRDVRDGIYAIGNVQRNLLFSDFILCQSEYMAEKIVSSYCLDGIYKGKILLGGYPRNSVFFDEKRAKANKQRLGLADKRVYVFMPTWRGDGGNRVNNDQTADLERYLKELDQKLTDDEVMLARLHPMTKASLDLTGFRHIKPLEGDVYSALAFADCLVTDYSSVFFDFAVTGRKIVLFTYDEEEYANGRGMYLSLDELPFPKVKNTDALISQLSSPKSYDDSAFIERFCKYESEDAAERLIGRVFDNKPMEREISLNDDGKENVLIFGGYMKRNGITASLVSLTEHLDLDRRRYFITYQQPVLRKYPMQAALLPEKAYPMPMCTKPQPTLAELAAQVLYYKLNFRPALALIERMLKRDRERFFGSVEFSQVVQFEGYGKDMMHLFRLFDCRRAVFVHNDMLKELKEKNIQHRLTLKKCYTEYDSVACVTEGMIPPVKAISGREDNITVVNNIHPYSSVAKRAEAPLSFDGDTEATVSQQELERLLDTVPIRLITIGRFSKEKGHDLLIDAFTRFHASHPDSLLIIIGGYGELYEQTLKLAKSSAAAERIVIIKSMSNPMPVLKRCGLFVLSSRHEALPVTIFEADTLHIPVVATDIPGVRDVMNKYGGVTVPTTSDGLLEGMEKHLRGETPTLDIDPEEYNRRALEQFEGLFG